MVPERTLTRIKNRINSFPELKGCRIGFHGNLSSQILDSGDKGSPNYNIIILIEELEKDLDLNFPPLPTPTVLHHANRTLNKTVVGAELLGAGLSCGLTVVSAAGVVGSAAAEVPTLGASTVVLVASWTGLVTQGIQCVNGIVRTVEAYRNPEDNSLQRWDSNAWYSRTILLIDAAGVISGVTSLGAAAGGIRRMLILRGALPSEGVLSAMTNAQRVQAYRQAVKRLSDNPALASEFDTLLRQLGPRVGNRLRRDSEVIIRRSVVSVRRVISEHTAKNLAKAVQEVVTNSIGIAASATPQEYVGSASGSVNWGANEIGNIVINITSQ